MVVLTFCDGGHVTLAKYRRIVRRWLVYHAAPIPLPNALGDFYSEPPGSSMEASHLYGDFQQTARAGPDRRSGRSRLS